jgi:DNA-binding transcriptional MerR regulator
MEDRHMSTDRPVELLSRGEFSRRSRLSPKALRIYDQIGLLRPVHVDASNGYRTYTAAQLPTARLIAMLRGIDMSLGEIGQLLDDLAEDPDLRTRRLDMHLLELEARHSGRRSLVRHIHALLRQEDPPMFPIETRQVPARRLMSIQRRLKASETDAFVREAKKLFSAHLHTTRPVGPFVLIFHGVVDDDNDGPLEATLVCSEDVGPTELIGIRTESAHDEAFTTITKAQWEYPAILAAYDAVACSPEAVARPGSRLSCREVYLAEPDAIADDDLVCDIAFPLGEVDMTDFGRDPA